MTKRLFILRDAQVRKHCAHYIMTEAPEGFAVKVTEANRTLDQNAKFHAICSDLARSKLQWCGKFRTADQWKVLLVSGHAVATKEGAEVIPGIEGEFINIRESTALMSKKRGSSLIEYAIAFCSQNAVMLSDESRLAE